MASGDVTLVGVGERQVFDLLGDGNLWYVLLTDTSVECTTPFENRPDMADTRMVVDQVCRAISKMLARKNGGEYEETTVEYFDVGDAAGDPGGDGAVDPAG